MNLFNDLAEKELLKSLLYDSARCEWALANITPDHFYSLKNRQIYERIIKLMKSAKQINVVTMLETDHTFEKEVMELSSEAYTAENAQSQAEVMLNLYYKREAQKRLLGLSQHVTEVDASPDSIREKAEELAYFLSARSDFRTLVPISVMVNETLKEFERIAAKGRPGVPTGFRDLDRLGWTLRPKTMTIIAARPGMGKSALALNMCERNGTPSAYFSLEMQGIEQCERLFSQKMGFSNNELRDQDFIRKSKIAIEKTAAEISKLPIYINDTPTISPVQLRMQLKRAIAKWGIRVAFIDYMGYLEDSDEKTDNRRLEMGKYSRAIKQMAKELNIAMVPICQLNRKCEERPDKRPILSDLREVGDLEQDAHMVLCIYRDSMYNDEANENIAEVLCRKCRGGITGMVKLRWNGRLTNFSDYEDDMGKF